MILAQYTQRHDNRFLAQSKRHSANQLYTNLNFSQRSLLNSKYMSVGLSTIHAVWHIQKFKHLHMCWLKQNSDDSIM